MQVKGSQLRALNALQTHRLFPNWRRSLKAGTTNVSGQEENLTKTNRGLTLEKC